MKVNLEVDIWGQNGDGLKFKTDPDNRYNVQIDVIGDYSVSQTFYLPLSEIEDAIAKFRYIKGDD